VAGVELWSWIGWLAASGATIAAINCEQYVPRVPCGSCRAHRREPRPDARFCGPKAADGQQNLLVKLWSTSAAQSRAPRVRRGICSGKRGQRRPRMLLVAAVGGSARARSVHWYGKCFQSCFAAAAEDSRAPPKPPLSNHSQRGTCNAATAPSHSPSQSASAAFSSASRDVAAST
jgi:hypothetical protein